MENKLADIILMSSKINKQHIQFVLAIVALAMLVLGIGAPADGGMNPH